MSQYACKLLTDAGTSFIAYDNTIDQFISKPLASLAEVAEVLDGDVEEAEAAAEQHTFDMRREVIHDATYYLSQLKLGKTLRVSEMIRLNNFYEFLHATVAPHQWGCSELSDSVIDKWISELNLDVEYPGYDHNDLLDVTVYPAFQEAPQRRAYPYVFCASEPRKRPRVVQNKFAGRYVSGLAIAANIAGPGKNTPEEIVLRYYLKLTTPKK